MNKQTLGDQVTHAIREAILTGFFKPGQRLSEPDLAKWLDVSLTPVREALGTLAGTGLVVRGGRQGTYVRTLGTRDVENLLAVRESLEVLAIRQGVPHFTSRDDEHLGSIVQDQAHATELAADDAARAVPILADLNDAFHQRILDRAGNEWLTSMLASIQDLLVFARSRLRMEAPVHRRRGSLEEHRTILEAIVRRDVEAASERMREHIANTRDHILPLVPTPASPSNQDVSATPFGESLSFPAGPSGAGERMGGADGSTHGNDS